MKHFFFAIAFCVTLFFVAMISAGEKQRLYVGTYTGQGEKDAKGIYMCELDLENGSLTGPTLVAECASPAFLAAHPKKKNLLYAVGEVWNYKNPGGPVYAFSVEQKSGKLTMLNTEDVPGSGPCHLCVAADPESENAVVVVASYGGGSVSSLPILADGKLGKVASTIKHKGDLGPNKQRQDAPHPHGVYIDSPDHLTVVVPDLGLDCLVIYTLDLETGELTAVMDDSGENQHFTLLHPGAGPRHIAVHATHDIGIVVNELDSTVSVLAVEEPGEIPPRYSTLPENVDPKSCGNSTAEIFFHPNGNFFYVSNRGHDSIAVFSIDLKGDPRETPYVKLIQNAQSGGKEPRSFCIEPSGRFLIVANQKSDNLVVFKIDQETGKLTELDQKITIPKPVCVIPFMAE